jgi:hypothetical protein
VGNATNGPADGLPYLATNPGHNYPDDANDWVRLPMIDLSAYQSCQFRVTVTLWRSAEKYAGVDYDGGNLQYTTVAAGTSGWKALDGPNMAYDGQLIDANSPCLVLNQNVWTTSANPKAKTAVYTSTTPPGDSLWLRFTFYSDVDNVNGPLPGLFIGSVLVEAY